MNFFIVGAPVSEFQFEAPNSYGNIEFIGQEVRNWKRNGDRYQVFLHTPLSGAYTLLATYDSRFNPHGEVRDFTGLKPLGTQSEQGTIIVTSEHYTDCPRLISENVSTALIEIEHGKFRRVPPTLRRAYTVQLSVHRATLCSKPQSQALHSINHCGPSC